MIKKIVVYAVPLLLFPLITAIPNRPLTIIPAIGGGPEYRLETYVDYTDTTRGSLGSLEGTNDSMIVFSYTLRTVNDNATIKPISGVTMIFDKYWEGRFLDLGGYDYLDIDVSMKEASSFVLYIKTFEHFTDTTKWFTQRYTEKEVQLEPRKTRYRFEFRKFTTPNWWKSLIGPRYLTLPEGADYTKVMAIDFQNNPGGEIGVPERMEIRRIEFRRSRRGYFVAAVIITLLWVAAVFLTFSVKGRSRRLGAGKSVKPLSLTNHWEEQLAQIEEYIGSNYQNPALSVEMISRERGIGLPRISTLLQQKHRMNFKQYLNDVRIKEAKRLLHETDRTIAEIAFAVGYNSIPHFNRVFRQHTDKTPTEFRDRSRHQEKSV